MDGKRFIANVKGVGIKSVTREYYMSSSDTELAGGEWSTAIPNLAEDNRYLWYRDVFTLTDGKKATTSPLCDGAWAKIYNIYEINDNVSEYVEAVERVSGEISDVNSRIDEHDGRFEEISNSLENLGTEIQPLNRGGTGATTADEALKNLGAAPQNHTHTFGEVLLTGVNWVTGSKKTIPNISRYTLYLIKFEDYNCPLLGVRYGSRIYASNAFVTESPADDQRMYTAHFTISGSSVMLEGTSAMTHKDDGGHGSWTGPNVQYIKGII